jgi:hypothetical protein
VHQAAHKLGFLLGHRDRHGQCRREASDGLAIFGFLFAIDAGVSFVIQQAVMCAEIGFVSWAGPLSVIWAVSNSNLMIEKSGCQPADETTILNFSATIRATWIEGPLPIRVRNETFSPISRHPSLPPPNFTCRQIEPFRFGS